MKLTRFIAGFAVAVGLSACAASGPVTETASRNAQDLTPIVASELTLRSVDWRLEDVRVLVPGDLKVSEANRYYPIADIVWREDPYGDRHAQVAKIIDDGITSGLTHLNGDRPVYFDLTVKRFHSLTEKTRYSVGGVHNIVYTLTVVDAATGVALHGPIEMKVALKAFGGDQAVAAERRGETQKVRIQSHLASLMRQAFNGGQEMRVVAKAAVAPQGAYTGVIQ
ncbi:DUF6778 family protein [Litoreibacter albidus]|uniref:Lipoprotein n=1 Tax=Litoreibacter albidus TaxID=670155 RepID=A0A1H3B9Y0_9RHOB|nr:DUF6778 family protein [Litoreibacter albidus]SDX38747.1 hypothetical protein SAMN04488001_3107 [Litoreibacter albidus]